MSYIFGHLRKMFPLASKKSNIDLYLWVVFYASAFIEVINALLCKWLHLEKSLPNTMGLPLAHSKFKLSHNFAEFKEMFFRQKVLFVRTLYESLLYWGYAQLCKWLYSKFSRGETHFYSHLKMYFNTYIWVCVIALINAVVQYVGITPWPSPPIKKWGKLRNF